MLKFKIIYVIILDLDSLLLTQQRFLLLLSILMLAFMLSYISITSNATAQSSSSFMRQVIEDPTNDIKSPFTKNTTGKPVTYVSPNTACLKNNTVPLDIESASFQSDGENLRTTMWLKNPFIESPKPDIARNWKHVEYTMYLSVNSIYHIGVDYLVRLFWNNTADNWTYQVVEISPFHEKILSSINSPKGIYKNGSNYINLDFNLGLADHPKQYQLFFVSGATYFVNSTQLTGNKKITNSYECGLLDVTNLVAAPPPEFTVSFDPSSLQLRPNSWLENGDKSVLVKIQSKTNLDSKALFILPSNRTSGIQTNFTSNTLSLLPEDTSSTTLKIRALDVYPLQSYPISYSIPVLSNITFPQNFTADIGQKYTFDSNKIATITKNSTLNITVLPPLSIFDYLQLTANWLSPINSIWTFITAAGVIIVPFIIRRYSKKKSEGLQT